jgi:Protein of unknown function (DUF3152)
VGLRTLFVSLVVVAAGLFPAPARAADPIVNTDPPVVSGAATFGVALRVSTGSWTPDGLTFTYSWARDGKVIAGATTARHRLGLDDLGHTLTATVTAADGQGGSQSVTTEPTATVKRARLTVVSAPAVSGVTRYTHRLTASRGTWSKKPAKLRYQWLRAGKPVTGATRPSYVLGVKDVGRRIRVQVTARRPGYVKRTVRSASTRRIRHLVPVKRSVTYTVATRGKITADLGVFKKQVQQTYDDPRGWRAAGVKFRRVAKGGTFTVVLAQAGTVPSFSSACSAEWSCRVGRYVIINQTRWLHATPSWNSRKLPLRGYRHMVVNHETGHWLGHGHASCPGSGRLAPVMMQQSKSLAGCRHNPWPLPSERWFRIAARTAAKAAADDRSSFARAQVE